MKGNTLTMGDGQWVIARPVTDEQKTKIYFDDLVSRLDEIKNDHTFLSI